MLMQKGQANNWNTVNTTRSGIELSVYDAGKERVATLVNGNPHFIHRDHINSGGVISTNNGGVNDRVAFAPYGEVTYQQNTNSYIEEKFTGQILDEETGLYYFNARYYDPVIGVFTSADSIVPDPYDSQSLNRYMYCRGNPVKYVDPDGHAFWNTALSAVATLAWNIVGIATAITSGGSAGTFGYVAIGENGSFSVGGVAWGGGFGGAIQTSYNASSGDFQIYGSASVKVNSSQFWNGNDDNYYRNENFGKGQGIGFGAALQSKLYKRKIEKIISKKWDPQVPLKGNVQISSKYGMRLNPFTGIYGMHGGLDLVSDDVRIYPIEEGIVLKVNYNKENTSGMYVVIRHKINSNKYIHSSYCHLNSIHIYKGARVYKSTVIGIMGSTGNSTGPHLHLGVTQLEVFNGVTSVERINPEDIIPKIN